MKLPGRMRWRSRCPGLGLQYLFTIAIGMGTISAVASFVVSLGTQPLPLYRPDQLFAVWEQSRLGGAELGISGPDLADLASAAGPELYSLGPFTSDPMWLKDGGGNLPVRALMIDAKTFAGLGVRTLLGRGPIASDRPANSGSVAPAWISSSLWLRRYAARRNIIGMPIELGPNATFAHSLRLDIAGVLMPGTNLPLPFLEEGGDVWYILPDNPGSRRDAGLFGVGRLRENVSVARAGSALNAAADNLGRKYRFDANKRVRVEALREIADAPVRRTLGLVVLAVCLAFLVACCNITVLLLSVSDRRRTDLAIRRALGARTIHLWLDAAAGSVAITLFGLLGGLVLAWWGIHLLTSAAPALGITDLAGNTAALRAPVVAAFAGSALLIALLWTTLLANPFPRTTSTASDLNCDHGALAAQGKSRLGTPWRSALVASQACLVVVVIAVAGAAVHSYFAQSAASLGPSPDHTLALNLNPRGQGGNPGQALEWKQRLLAELAGTQGIRAAAFTDQLEPLGTPTSFTRIDDNPGTQRSALPPISVSPRYFQLFAIPILYGRGFTDADDRVSPVPAAVVNQTLAAENWPSPQQAVGATIVFGAGKYAQRYQIVGVAADFGGYWFRQVPPMAYVPLSQSGYDGGTLIVRSTTPPGTVVRELRALVAALPTNLDISGSSTVAELWAQALTRPRARMDGMLLVTLLTLGLGIQGIYVTGTWMVQARRHELAVRLALGANPGHLAALVLSQVVLPAAAGAAAAGVAVPLLAPLLAHWLGGC